MNIIPLVPAKTQENIILVIAVASETSSAHNYLEKIKTEIAKYNLDVGNCYDHCFHLLISEGGLPGDRQMGEIATEIGGKRIWDQAHYRVEMGSFNNEALGQGLLIVVFEGDFAHGPLTRCANCGRAIMIDQESDYRGWRCSAIGCREIYCGDDNCHPHEARCHCGGRIMLTKISYQSTSDIPVKAPAKTREITADDVVLEIPNLVKIMIPGGFVTLELGGPLEAEDTFRLLRSVIREARITAIEYPTGVSIHTIEEIGSLLNRSGIADKARWSVTAV